MNGRVYGNSGEIFCGALQSETNKVDYGKRFLSLVCNKISEIICPSWSERRNMSLLLSECVKKDILGRDGLLEQYLHSQLDIISESFKQEFGIEAKICENHATHAKMSDHIDAIKRINNVKYFNEASWKQGEHDSIVKYLDEKDVPRKDGDMELSIIGRIEHYINTQNQNK